MQGSGHRLDQCNITGGDNTACITSGRAVSASTHGPLMGTALEKAREKRLLQKKTWSVINEMWFYFCFLVLVSFIAWGRQDNRVFQMNEHLHKMLVVDNGRFGTHKV